MPLDLVESTRVAYDSRMLVWLYSGTIPSAECRALVLSSTRKRDIVEVEIEYYW